MTDDPQTAVRALGIVRAATKEALAELRATLASLRADDTPGPPQPRLVDLPALAAQARNNGLAVALTTDVEAMEFSPAVELTAGDPRGHAVRAVLPLNGWSTGGPVPVG